MAALGLALVVLSQTVFTRTTYVITDGNRILVHTTAAKDPRTVLGEVGVELGPEDAYTTHPEGSSAAIQVRRCQSVCIDYYGQKLYASSKGEEVGQLLARLGLFWKSGDVISVPLDTATCDGMEISVARVEQMEQTYAAVLYHETVRCSDPSLPRGTEKVLTNGTDGELLCTARVSYVNGVETDRAVLTQQVTIQPVDELIAVGSGAPVPRDGAESRMPVITGSTITLATGEVLTYNDMLVSYATAYCDKGLTATGTQARVGAIAVDPEVIPYGTRMFIMSMDGEYVYGIATAEDCGSREHIYGTRTDLHFDTPEECRQFGARDCLIFFLS